jgi:hypothetical protein
MLRPLFHPGSPEWYVVAVSGSGELVREEEKVLEEEYRPYAID